VSSALLLVLLAAGVVAIGLARLIPTPTPARLLDIAGTALAAVVLIDAIIVLTGS
jgi:hypothetical protein